MFIKKILILTVAALSLHAVPAIASEDFKYKVAEQMDKIKELSQDIKEYSEEKSQKVKKDLILSKYASLSSYHHALFKMFKNDNNPLKDMGKSNDHLIQAIDLSEKGIDVAKEMISKEKDRHLKGQLKKRLKDLKNKHESYLQDKEF